jgi:hydroxymethylbilane synthase
MKLRLGTRGSLLARLQTEMVTRKLAALGHEVGTSIISTAGDRVTDRTFAEVGSFGVFVREIEAALIAGEIDVAVHSYKDLPSIGPEQLIVAAVPERLDPADVLVTRTDQSARDQPIPLRLGATVGTASARRQALLATARPDLVIGLLRGNVPTRLSAVRTGRFDAIVLAGAGLARLERSPEGVTRTDLVVTRLDPGTFVPAPAQGAIAVQVRRDASAVREAVAQIDDRSTAQGLTAERALLARAQAGCSLPLGAWCQVSPGGELTLIAVLGQEGGGLARAESSGSDPVALADRVWERLAAAVTR